MHCKMILYSGLVLCIVPFVLDSYGKLVKQAKTLIEELADSSEAAGRQRAESFTRLMTKRIIFCLHRGNAGIRTVGAIHTRRAALARAEPQAAAPQRRR